MISNVCLDVVVKHPRVYLKLPSGVDLKFFVPVVDYGSSCEKCAFNNSYICPLVDCTNVYYVANLE